MITFGVRRARNGRRSRTWNKYMRGAKNVKNFEGNHVAMRRFNYMGRTVFTGNIEKFLLANVGRPVDKIYSEYLKRCRLSMTNPKKLFYRNIRDKSELSSRFGGFYVTNGILNFKKRKRNKNERSR